MNLSRSFLHRTAKTIKGQTLRAMILRGVEQQRAAIDAGDIELAEAFAATTTMLLDRHLHRAEHFGTSVPR